jgi:hypothetical protein
MKPIKEAIKNIVDNHTTYAGVHPIDIDFDELTTELCKKLEAMYKIVEGDIKEWGDKYRVERDLETTVKLSVKVRTLEQILQKFNKELNIEE